MKWLRMSIFGLLIAMMIAAGVFLCIVIPSLRADWVGYDVELSAGMVWIVWMSDIAVKYPYFALPAGVGVCVVAGYLLGVFGSSDGRLG